MDSLLKFTNKGIYCEQADLFIDPWKPVKKALITHGHSDHARYGHHQYLTTPLTAPILKHRLSPELQIQTMKFGSSIVSNGVKISFHPAGHLPGSAQVRLEYKGEIWVVSGDYKLSYDPLSEAFEPIKCHGFITECTFGLPVFDWQPHEITADALNQWWIQNQSKGLTSVIGGYALGKAQRILSSLNPQIGKIYTHGAIENINQVFRENGLDLPETHRVIKDKKIDYTGQMVIATPSAFNSSWMNQFKPYTTAIASGWMAMRGTRRRRSVDRGFIISDHADWKELNRAVAATEAEKVICTHGYTEIFSQWLKEKGIDAMAEKTAYEGELGEIDEVNENTNTP